MPGGRWEIGIWLDFFRKYWANYVLFCLYKKKQISFRKSKALVICTTKLRNWKKVYNNIDRGSFQR